MVNYFPHLLSMSLPAIYHEALITTLVLAEDLACLVVDDALTVQFASPQAADYGLSNPSSLRSAPDWISALCPRFTQLFERPALFTHTTLDGDLHQVFIQARVVQIEGVARLLVLLRRPADASPQAIAPYDAITGLYSAAFLAQKIDEELERLKRFPAVFSLLALDVAPLPELLTPLADLLRIHFRVIDIVGHAPSGGFWVLLPGTTLDQAQLAGARLAALAADFHVMLPAPVSVRYTAIEAGATDTRATLCTRLDDAEALPAQS